MSAAGPVVAEPVKAPVQSVVEPTRTCACGGKIEAGGECSKCRARRMLQRSAIGPAPRAVPGIVRTVASLPGHPLDAHTRGEMEQRFGHDFGRVRIHSGDLAYEAARSVNALAYTYGDAIAFGPGAYAPGTKAGRRLLAHELAHVVQQARGIGGSTEAFLEADAAAAAEAASSMRPIHVTGAAPITIQRQEAPAHGFDPNDILFEDCPSFATWRALFSNKFKSMPTESEAREVFASVASAEELKACSVTFHGTPDQFSWWSFSHPTRGEIGRVTARFVSLVDASGTGTTKKFGVILCYNPPRVTGKPEGQGAPGLEGSGERQEGGKKKEEGKAPGEGKTEEQKKGGDASLERAIERGKQLENVMASPVTAAPDVLKDPQAAAFYLLILEHYSGRPVTPADEAAAKDGLTKDEIATIVGFNPLRRALTDLYTQGFTEFKAAGGTDFDHFKLLVQTVEEQFTRGNPNAALNRLKIGKGGPEPDILGIVERPTNFLLYNQFGIPIKGLTGIGLRDRGYIGSRNETDIGADIAKIEDPGVRVLLNTLRVTFGDPTRMAIEAANIYMENIDRVNAEVRSGLSTEVLEKFEQMIVPFVGFIAGHAVSSFLLRFPNPQVAAVGLALKGLLTAAGYVMDIQFGAEALQRLMQAAAELVKVEKNEKGELTKLSETHIKNAAVPIRQMVADIALMAGLKALGGLISLAFKGLKKLQIKCTFCELKELIAREEGKAPENIPPEKPKVEAGPSPRGFAIEDVHLDNVGYQSLRKAGSVPGIDGIRGGDVEIITKGGQVIKRYHRPDAVSVKSTDITDPAKLTDKVTRELRPLQGRYEYSGGGIEINGLGERRYDLVFEEGAFSRFTKETISALDALKAKSGSINFRWYVNVGGKEFYGPEFVAKQSKALKDL